MYVYIHAHSQAGNIIILNVVQISTCALLSELNTTINIIIINPTMYINVVPCTEMGT